MARISLASCVVILPHLSDRATPAADRRRAELKLAERAALWNAKLENRHLPSFWEWAIIRFLTKKKHWTGIEQAIMRKAFGQKGIDIHPESISMRHPNQLGFFDTLGNVAEWCHDVEVDAHDPRKTPSEDTLTVGDGTFRIARSGCVKDSLIDITAESLDTLAPTTKSPLVGFRVARNAPHELIGEQ